MTKYPVYDNETGDRLDTPPHAIDEPAKRFLYESYDLLRSIEKYADWDADYYDWAVKLRERLGNYLWPDAIQDTEGQKQ